MRRLPYTSYAAPRRGGQVVQTEASIGSHSGSIPDPAADADTDSPPPPYSLGDEAEVCRSSRTAVRRSVGQRPAVRHRNTRIRTHRHPDRGLLAAVQVPTPTVRARLSSTSLGSGFHRSTGWGSTRPATKGRRAEDLAGHDGAGAPARAYLFHDVGRPRRLRRRGRDPGGMGYGVTGAHRPLARCPLRSAAR